MFFFFLFFFPKQTGQHISDLFIRSSSKDGIHLRNLINDLLFVALCKTSCYDQGTAFSFFFVTCHL